MNQLMALYGFNRGIKNRRFETVTNAANTESTLYIYDMIVSDALTAEWMGGVDAQTFVNALSAITAPTIHIRINSPGGDVFAARAIEQSIKTHPSNIIAHIDGVAASAATYIALAADEIRANEGALFMIHNAWTSTAGDSRDLMATANLLSKIDGTLAQTYSTKSGKPIDEITPLMDAETWFTAQEAVDFGFVDSIEQGKTAKALWNMAVYKNAPVIEPEPIPEPEQPTNQPILKPDFSAMERQLRLATAI